MHLLDSALLALGAAVFASAAAAPAVPVVLTTSGKLRGFSPAAGVHAYLGIPYAQPPTGARRFQPAQPLPRTSAPVDATRFGKACMQFNYRTPYAVAFPAPPFAQSEDCLTLNVWVPARAPAAARLPSLVWIYGGAFGEGWAGDPGMRARTPARRARR